jgi:hypothetical protein
MISCKTFETGLLDLKSVPKSDGHVWSSQDAQTWLTNYERAKRDLQQVISLFQNSVIFKKTVFKQIFYFNCLENFNKTFKHKFILIYETTGWK